MRLCASVLAIAVLSPLSAFAQGEPPPAAPATPPADAPAAAAPAAATPVVAAPVAAPAPAPAPAPAAAPAKTWKDLIVIDGLVDSYYMYNFSGPTSLSGPIARNFDVNSNTFTLGYAKVGIGLTADKVALRMDLGWGQTGQIINAAVPPAAPAMGGATLTPFLVQQAYASLTPIDNLTIDFGKFVTTAGAEVIESNKNWLYSRSFLFFNIPLVHTGLRVGYKINDMLSLQGSVVNGWNGNGIDPDVNEAKTFGLSATVTLPVGVVIIPTVYFGKEVTGGDTRVLVDVVASYSAGPLGLNLNIDYLKDTAAGIDPFIGAAAMAHYAVSDALNATLRGEYAQQKTMGTWAKFYEVTAGVALPFSGHYEIRPEFRIDMSPDTVFYGKKNQVTGTVAALAYF